MLRLVSLGGLVREVCDPPRHLKRRLLSMAAFHAKEIAARLRAPPIGHPALCDLQRVVVALDGAMLAIASQRVGAILHRLSRQSDI